MYDQKLVDMKSEGLLQKRSHDKLFLRFFMSHAAGLFSCIADFVQFDRLFQNAYFVAATPSYVKLARCGDECTNHEATAPLLLVEKDWPKVALQNEFIEDFSRLV